MSSYNQILHTMDDQQLAAATLAARENGEIALFNVAAWVNAPGCQNEEFALTLCYIDGGKAHEVPVDRGRINAMQDILLSGVAQLPVRKKLEKVQLQLRAARAHIGLVVEDVCLQPAH